MLQTRQGVFRIVPKFPKMPRNVPKRPKMSTSDTSLSEWSCFFHSSELLSTTNYRATFSTSFFSHFSELFSQLPDLLLSKSAFPQSLPRHVLQEVIFRYLFCNHFFICCTCSVRKPYRIRYKSPNWQEAAQIIHKLTISTT